MSPKEDLQAWDGEICGEKYLIMPYCTRSFKRRWMLVQAMLHELLRLICSYWHESFDISMDICRDFLYTHMDINFFPYEHCYFFAWAMLDTHKLIFVNLPRVETYRYSTFYILFLIPTTLFCTKKYYERIIILDHIVILVKFSMTSPVLFAVT